jgi:hypothetical protein
MTEDLLPVGVGIKAQDMKDNLFENPQTFNPEEFDLSKEKILYFSDTPDVSDNGKDFHAVITYFIKDGCIYVLDFGNNSGKSPESKV